MVLKVKASDTRARGRGSTGQVVHTSSVTIWYWPKASAPAGKDSLSPGYESPAGLSLPRDLLVDNARIVYGTTFIYRNQR